MQEYRVTWGLDVTADSPEEAAQKALETQRDPESLATIFDVSGEAWGCPPIRIDLSADLGQGRYTLLNQPKTDQLSELISIYDRTERAIKADLSAAPKWAQALQQLLSHAADEWGVDLEAFEGVFMAVDAIEAARRDADPDPLAANILEAREERRELVAALEAAAAQVSPALKARL